MKDADRQTRSYLMKLFEEHGFHPRTDLGQNFLIDLNLIDYVVDHADLSSDDVVLEIGAGTGSMTAQLALGAAAVVSVEVDANMHGLARAAIAPFENVTLLHCDALKNKNHFSPTVLEAIQRALDADPKRRLKLVANLPYSIATPVVSNLVATDLPWARMILTIQYELGLRMGAKPRSSHYGSLSVWLQSQCHVKLLRKLGPTVFWPRPQVNSAIMQITPHKSAAAKIVDREFFHDYVRRLFHQRRKLLRSVLVGMYRKQVSKPEIDELLAAAGLEDTVRAEEMSVQAHVALANRLHAAIHGTVNV
ncbi:MAG: ribosomal RNA small subunit methyltransferase A [Planctomycetaceae bacterium]|nr:ribosomal RNA small subunit methyltransferase A [Planctomycetaceae bacterium]